jgi:hypothetical protein
MADGHMRLQKKWTNFLLLPIGMKLGYRWYVFAYSIRLAPDKPANMEWLFRGSFSGPSQEKK